MLEPAASATAADSRASILEALSSSCSARGSKGIVHGHSILLEEASEATDQTCHRVVRLRSRHSAALLPGLTATLLAILWLRAHLELAAPPLWGMRARQELPDA